jgi:hypothetical protein
MASELTVAELTAKLAKAQAELAEAQAELAQAKLAEAQGELAETQAELAEAQAVVAEAQAEVAGSKRGREEEPAEPKAKRGGAGAAAGGGGLVSKEDAKALVEKVKRLLDQARTNVGTLTAEGVGWAHPKQWRVELDACERELKAALDLLRSECAGLVAGVQALVPMVGEVRDRLMRAMEEEYSDTDDSSSDGSGRDGSDDEEDALDDDEL